MMMGWTALLGLIRSEVGPEAAARIEARCRREIQGLRVTVPSRPHPTDADVQSAMRQAGFNVSKAAKVLGVAKVTLYRRLARPKIIR